MSGKGSFGKLLEPGQIGRVKTRNRIVKTAAALAYRDEKTYHVTDRIKGFYEAIAKGGVGLTVITKEGEKQTIEADTIVPALLLRPNTELFKMLEGKVPEIYAIGDCREPHLTLEAIADGSRIARAI